MRCRHQHVQPRVADGSVRRSRAAGKGCMLPMMALNPESVAEVLRRLEPLEEKVVRLSFGLGCQRCHAADEIAHEFEVSPEVIDKVLSAAEGKLAQAGLRREELRAAGLRERMARPAPLLRCHHNFRN